jgi:hypothetical protein
MTYSDFFFGFACGCLFTTLAAGILAWRLLAPFVKQASKNQRPHQ